MPIELTGMPVEVQTAFFILDFLPDVWDGMSGTYMGKDWSGLEYFMNLYEVENPKAVIMFMKMYETITVNYRAEKAQNERKSQERRAKQSQGSGRNYAHNVRG